jgi:hypothetical protein
MTEKKDLSPRGNEANELRFAKTLADRRTKLLEPKVCDCPLLSIPITTECTHLPKDTQCPSKDCWNVAFKIATFDFISRPEKDWLELTKTFTEEENFYYWHTMDCYLKNGSQTA